MKKVAFTIKDHSDRIALLEAFQSNGYEVDIKNRTEYMPPKVMVEVYVEDCEVIE